MAEMLEFEEFLICPNCKQPLIRRSALNKGCRLGGDFCGKCGVNIACMFQDVQAMNEKSDELLNLTSV